MDLGIRIHVIVAGMIDFLEDLVAEAVAVEAAVEAVVVEAAEATKNGKKLPSVCCSSIALSILCSA